MDFDNPKVNGDTFISDGLVFASTSLDNISNFLVICYDCPCHKGFTHVDCRAIRPTSPQTTFPQWHYHNCIAQRWRSLIVIVIYLQLQRCFICIKSPGRAVGDGGVSWWQTQKLISWYFWQATATEVGDCQRLQTNCAQDVQRVRHYFKCPQHARRAN